LHSGDLIFFVSTRRTLDVFHAGIIVRDGNTVLMRHASRSHGFVVEQELSEFLKANRMAGVIVARPQGVKRGASRSVTRMTRLSISRHPSSQRKNGAPRRGGM